MKVIGIIAEYNPFHNGHAYQIRESRRLLNADYVIVVMGGNFMQRGEAAIIDKFSRAEMALLNGADLVLELPVPFATGSAEYFATGAVSLLNETGVVSHLCFGSESGDLSFLSNVSSILLEEPDSFRSALKGGLKCGLSFPQARSQALKNVLPSQEEDFFTKPNNILAVEYLKALRKTQSSISPFTIRRLGSYHDLSVNAEFASASAIRNSCFTNPETFYEAISGKMPVSAVRILVRELSHHGIPSSDAFSLFLYQKLLKLSSYQELCPYLDISEDLARRIFALRECFTGYEAFLDLVKTRQYTHTRISRCLLHFLLDIKQSDTDFPKYFRVLGFRKEAAPLLGEIKKRGSLPLITKLAASHKILDSRGISALKKDLFSSSIYHALSPGGLPYNEYTRQLVLT